MLHHFTWNHGRSKMSLVAFQICHSATKDMESCNDIASERYLPRTFPAAQHFQRGCMAQSNMGKMPQCSRKSVQPQLAKVSDAKYVAEM